MVPFRISFVLLLTLTMLNVWIIIGSNLTAKVKSQTPRTLYLAYMNYSIYLPCTSGSSKSPKSYSWCLNICLDCVKKPADLNSIRDVLKKTHLFSEIKLLRWLSVSGKKRSVLLSIWPGWFGIAFSKMGMQFLLYFMVGLAHGEYGKAGTTVQGDVHWIHFFMFFTYLFKCSLAPVSCM